VAHEVAYGESWAQRRSPTSIPQLPFRSDRPSYIMATRIRRVIYFAVLQGPSKANTLINFLQFGTRINDEGGRPILTALVCFSVGHSAPWSLGATILTPSMPSSEPSSHTTQKSPFYHPVELAISQWPPLPTPIKSMTSLQTRRLATFRANRITMRCRMSG
jgi:hypothetical protein